MQNRLMLDANQSTATTGYCILRFGNTEPYTEIITEQINKNEPLTVNIKSENDTDLKVISQWGTAANKAQNLANGED